MMLDYRGSSVMLTGLLLQLAWLLVTFSIPEVTPSPISPQQDEFNIQSYGQDDTQLFEEMKRGGFRPIPFPCNGYDNIPRCLNNGRGPRKTWTKQGRFCVCLCPPKWIGPECGYAANSLPGRRSAFPWN